MKVALAHKGWWVRIHRAVRGMYDDTMESFPDFVRRAYTSDRPSELGKMAIAFAFASNVDGSPIYTLVDRLVVSDMAYVSTVEGMECLILLAILYADEGQPRRSWLIYRRGIMVAHSTVCQTSCSAVEFWKLMMFMMSKGPVPGWPPINSQETALAVHLPSRPYDELVPRFTVRLCRHAPSANPRGEAARK